MQLACQRRNLSSKMQEITVFQNIWKQQKLLSHVLNLLSTNHAFFLILPRKAQWRAPGKRAVVMKIAAALLLNDSR